MIRSLTTSYKKVFLTSIKSARPGDYNIVILEDKNHFQEFYKGLKFGSLQNALYLKIFYLCELQLNISLYNFVHKLSMKLVYSLTEMKMII